MSPVKKQYFLNLGLFPETFTTFKILYFNFNGQQIILPVKFDYFVVNINRGYIFLSNLPAGKIVLMSGKTIVINLLLVYRPVNGKNFLDLGLSNVKKYLICFSSQKCTSIFKVLLI